jgi:hypothetical protein
MMKLANHSVSGYIVHYFLILMLSCMPSVKNTLFPPIKISVPSDMPIKEKELVQILKSKLGPEENTKKYSVELTIVSYTSGKEIFSLSDSSNDTIKVDRTRGSIEAMIKIRVLNRIKQVYFVQATGRTKDEIIDNLVERLKEVLD